MRIFLGSLFVFSWSLLGQPPTSQEFGGLTAKSHPFHIVAGPDGALWFTEVGLNKVGRIATSGTVTEFPISNSFGAGITVGPDGALWFAEGVGVIGRITPAGTLKEFPSPEAAQGITTGPDGALWFAGTADIGRITTAGVVTKFPIPTANSSPGEITTGPDGALWFTEATANKIGRITTAGVITEFPIPTAASDPSGITSGPDGALWFAESHGNKIGRITVSGIVTEFSVPTANSGPTAITSGPDGALWFTEYYVDGIARITTTGGITEIPIATAGQPGKGLASITVGPDGALWFTEIGSNKIGRLALPSPPQTNDYTITTVAGNGNFSSSGDGGPATSAGINIARSVGVDQDGNLYITDAGTIRKVDASSQVIHTVAGGGQQTLQGNQPATAVSITNPWGVAADSLGNFYIAETGGHFVDWVSSGIINVLNTKLNSPGGLTVDSAGNVFVADSGNCRIVELTKTGGFSVVAGNGTCGYSGDGGLATSAELQNPSGVAADNSGNIYIADTSNSRVRKVSGGVINTIAGTGVNGSSGDGGPASSALLNGPTDVTVDSVGNLYVADYGNGRIRKVDTSQTINTIAGGGSGLSDGGPATSAQLSFPYGVAVDAAGDVFVGDAGDYRFRKLTPVLPLSLSSLAPISAVAGAAGFTLHVTGTGFVTSSVVQWNGSALATTYIDGSHLTASVSASLMVTAGAASLTVANPGGALSNALTFAVTSPTTGAPSIITASPLPAGVVGSQYSQALDATGGTTPYKNWTVISGSLPSGVSLTTLGGVLTGLLTGTPTTPGTFTFIVQVTDNAGATGTKQFSLTVSVAGSVSISTSGIVNSASYAGGSIAPGEIVTIYGSGMGPGTLVSFQLDQNGNVPTTLAGTQVLFNGVAAPLIYSSASQLSAVVPYEIAGQSSVPVQVSYQGQSSNTVTVPVVAVVPGIFTSDSSGHGQGAIVNQDGSINSTSNPAPAGSIVFLYGTGEGQSTPSGLDGKPDGSPAPTPIAQPGMTATIGGMNAQVLYAGGVPGLVAGVLQVNVQIPASAPVGSAVPIQLSLGGQASQTGVTVAIR